MLRKEVIYLKKKKESNRKKKKEGQSLTGSRGNKKWEGEEFQHKNKKNHRWTRQLQSTKGLKE